MSVGRGSADERAARPYLGMFQRGTTKILCAELGSLDRIGAMPVVFLEKKEPLVRQVKKKTL